jgi:dipeptidyl aminopeptidase/acylaminoacyl peptidase
LPIHGQLYLPPDYKARERYPALIYLHGGPNSEMVLGYHYHRFDYYQKPYGLIQYLANHGYIVMSVNYRRGTGYGMKFREPENVDNTDPRRSPDAIDIIGGGLYLKGRPDVDPNRVGIWGGSAGGQRTILGLLYGPDIFAAGFDLHGVATPVLGKTEGWKPPVLIVHGDDDRNVQFSQTVAFAGELRSRGVDVEMLVFPNEIHSFLRHESWLRAFEAAADFFDRKLKNRNAADQRDGKK